MNVLARSLHRSIPTVQKRMVINQPALRLLSTYFTESHEYIKVNGDIGTVGISEHACESLGDIVFVELPSVGDRFEAQEPYGTVESVKAASDVYMPVSGEVMEINERLESSPETVNESPYVEGWFVKVKMSDPSEVEKLMSEKDYDTFKDE